MYLKFSESNAKADGSHPMTAGGRTETPVQKTICAVALPEDIYK